MKKLLVAAALAVAAFTYALPSDLLVVSKKEVKADAAAGLSYLGSCASGNLYAGSAAALGRAAPYRTLDRDAAAKDYYVVWAPAAVKIEPGAFAHLGFAARLSGDEILVGVEKRMGGAAAIRAIESRTELRLLQPVTRVDWTYPGEKPPTEKDPAIEAAISAITPDLYGSYVQMLQDYETRSYDSHGLAGSRDFIKSFLEAQGLETSVFDFTIPLNPVTAVSGDRSTIWLGTNALTIKQSNDGGITWTSMDPRLGWYGFGWETHIDRGYFAGSARCVNYTYSIGREWAYWPFTVPGNYERICCRSLDIFDFDVGWIGGYTFTEPGNPVYTGFVLRTEDRGRTWSEAAIPDGYRVNKVVSYDGDAAWVVYEDRDRVPHVIFSADEGATWKASKLPAALTDLATAGPRICWATTGGNQLFRTTDGINCDVIDPGITGSFDAVEFPDPNHGFASGTSLIATDDGGATWRKVPLPNSSFVYSLSFGDPDEGVIGFDNLKSVYYTGDGGEEWWEMRTRPESYSANVIGERKGEVAPDEIVIIGGHFDCSAIDGDPGLAPGADDNASGTACALAAARAFRNMAFKRTVRYVAFDGEESGLLGSRAYAADCAARGEKIVAVLNADMVAYDEDHGARDDYIVDSTGAVSSWLGPYLSAVGRLYGNGLIYDSGGLGGDETSFRNHGYAAVGVIEGGTGVGGSMNYPYYHMTADTFDKLSPGLATRFARDFAATLAHLARSEYVGIEEPRDPTMAAKPVPRAFAVYPNPYRVASSASGIRFVGLAVPAAIAVYDITGRKVAGWNVGASAGDECTWRPAVGGGAALAPGIYIYTVEGDNQRESGKLALVK